MPQTATRPQGTLPELTRRQCREALDQLNYFRAVLERHLAELPDEGTAAPMSAPVPLPIVRAVVGLPAEDWRCQHSDFERTARGERAWLRLRGIDPAAGW